MKRNRKKEEKEKIIHPAPGQRVVNFTATIKIKRKSLFRKDLLHVVAFWHSELAAVQQYRGWGSTSRLLPSPWTGQASRTDVAFCGLTDEGHVAARSSAFTKKEKKKKGNTAGRTSPRVVEVICGAV